MTCKRTSPCHALYHILGCLHISYDIFILQRGTHCDILVKYSTAWHLSHENVMQQ